MQNPALPPGTVTFVPLINSGDLAFGEVFSGLPDGIGAVPLKRHFPEWLPYIGNRADYVDLYVNHEESHVPFGPANMPVFADFQDSSVTRVRIDTQSREVLEMEVVLPGDAGYIRFCSSFMAGPREGFPFYTLLLNEESNDVVPVTPGAPDEDPSAPDGRRQAGYSVWYNTVTGKYDTIPGAGRHNHENTVVVPGGWRFKVASLSGDDTFTSTSDPTRPNLSQMYMYLGRSWLDYRNDKGQLYAFQVTATHTGPLADPETATNGNDYFDIAAGMAPWQGRFIPVPDWAADGYDPANPTKLPQDVLEDWSNANNVFQFIRVEDIDYDPDNPRVVYFADTGNTRIETDATSAGAAAGRLYRNVSSNVANRPWMETDGRIFKFVLNAANPLVVDSFTVAAEGGMRQVNADGSITTLVAPWFRAPDNLDAGSNSLMLQEDASNAKIWQWDYAGTWTHVATVDRDNNTATSDAGESSGILDVSRWFGAGWWALDVQAHDTHILLEPNTASPDADPANPWPTWTTDPIPPGGNRYRYHLEAGQLLLMHVPGS
ncbi:MAG TPA: hypothetical protein VIA02_08115 [Candidatus Limnocylindria bacterium]